jgi:rod shape-determining protein MreC
LIIIAALVALMQILAARNGTESPVTAIGTSLVTLIQASVDRVSGGMRSGAAELSKLPQYARENADLRARNDALAMENARLNELLTAYKQQIAFAPSVASYPNRIAARVIGFPPEDETRTVTIDRGARDGVHKDDGVLAPQGVVGRVSQVGPISSEVTLLTDYTSRIPVVIQRGRWWGIARGNLTTIRLEYVTQDAALRLGDVVVTGEGRSFHSGAVIGTIVNILRNDASLYQTAVVKPAAELGALDRVVVVPR